MEKRLVSIIIPVYDEEEVLLISYERFTSALKGIDYNYEIIYIDDGSTDDSWEIISEIAKGDSRVKALSFSRNFGHQLAVTAGMDIASGDALVIIDVDLQDPPELIPKMLKMWEKGSQIVYGKRKKREGETVLKKFTAWMYYRVLNSLTPFTIPLDCGDFRLLDKSVAEQFLKMREHNRFLRGMSAWMGYESAPLEYERASREVGSTKYTLKKMLKLAVDGIAGFSYTPLTFPGWIGLVMLSLSGLGLLIMIILALTVGIAAWLWGLLSILMVQSVILITLGTQGAYMARMYDELKGRPLYIVKKSIGK